MDEVNSRVGQLRGDVREQLRQLLAVLPLARDLAHRPVRAQPRHDGQRSAQRAGSTSSTPTTAATRCPAGCRPPGYYTAEVGKYLNGYGSGDDQTLVPAGWSEWRGAAGDHAGGLQLHPERERDPGRIRPRPRGLQAGRDHRQGGRRRSTAAPRDDQPFFLDVNYTAPHSGGPNPNPNPPANCASTAKPAPRHANAFDDAPLPAAAELQRGRRLRQAGRRPPTWIRSRTPQRAEITRRYRCRIESLLSVDEGVASDRRRAARDEGARRHAVRLHLRQRLLPRRASGPEREGAPLRALDPGPAGDPRPWDPGEQERARAGRQRRPREHDPRRADADPGLAQDGRSLVGVAEEPNRERGREILLESQAFVGDQERALQVRRALRRCRAPARSSCTTSSRTPSELQSQHANPAYAAVRAQLDARLDALRDCSGAGCRTKPKPEAEAAEASAGA